METITYKEFKQKRINYKNEQVKKRPYTEGLENAFDAITEKMYKQYLNGHDKFAFLR